MHETMALALASLAGLSLGVIFFGGLWWTVHMGMTSSRPAHWFLVSFLLRMGIVMAGFYFIGQGDWHRLVACLVGFLIARLLITRFFGRLEKEASHAS